MEQENAKLFASLNVWTAWASDCDNRVMRFEPLRFRFVGAFVLVCSLASPLVAQDLSERVQRLLDAGLVKQAGLLLHESAPSLENVERKAAAFNNACVLLTRAGELETALADCARAIALRRGLSDTVGTGRSLNNQALALQTMGRLEEAEQGFEQALALNSENGEELSAVINLLNLGAVSSHRGNNDRAFRLYQDAEQHALAADADWTPRQVFIARQNQGSALERLEAHEEALRVYKLLQADHSNSLGAKESDLANVELNLGVVYRNLGDAVEAERRFRAAVDQFAAANDVAGEATAWLNLGLTQQLEFADLVSAMGAFEKAVSLARLSGDVPDQLRALSYLVEAQVTSGAMGEARATLEQTRTLVEGSEDTEAVWRLKVGQARLASAVGETELAIESAREAVASIGSLSALIAGAQRRSRFLEHRAAAFTFAVDLLLDQVEHRGAQDDPVTQQLLAEAFEIALRSKEQLRSRSDPEASDRLMSLGSGELAPMILEVLDGAALLEWIRLDETLIRFSLDARGLRHKRFSSPQRYFDAAVRIRRSLAASILPAESDVHLLSELLVDIDLPDRLFVAVSGSLGFFPWEILRSERDGGELLVDLTAVAMLPSAGALLSAGPARPEPGEVLRWVTVSVPQASSEGSSARSSASWIERLSSGTRPLRFAMEEVQMVADTLGGKGVALAQGAATGAAVLGFLDIEHGAGGAEIIHVAAHTVIDERPGGGAAILLEGMPLSADQLEHRSLRVGLAVLASCSTLVDELGSGRVLETLTGAWLRAGAQGVLATLWDVDDASTYALMEQFYAQLSRGLDPQVALAAAKRRLRSDPAWEQSAQWSAYVLVGNPRGVSLGRSRTRGFAVASLLLGLAICTAGFSRLRRARSQS